MKKETKAEGKRRSERIAAECSGYQDRYYIKYDLETTPEKAAAAIGISADEMDRHLSGECYKQSIKMSLIRLYQTMNKI